jgi:hypothetical protein
MASYTASTLNYVLSRLPTPLPFWPVQFYGCQFNGLHGVAVMQVPVLSRWRGHAGFSPEPPLVYWISKCCGHAGFSPEPLERSCGFQSQASFAFIQLCFYFLHYSFVPHFQNAYYAYNASDLHNAKLLKCYFPSMLQCYDATMLHR